MGCQGADTVGRGGVIESLGKSHSGRLGHDSVWGRGGVARVHRSGYHSGRPVSGNLERQLEGHQCWRSVVVDNLDKWS